MRKEFWFHRLLKWLGLIQEYEVSKKEMCEKAKSVCSRNCEKCAWHEEDFDKHTIQKTCANCICSRIRYGFRTGWKYLYCMIDEPSPFYGGKLVSSDHVCEHWRCTK